MSAVVESAVDRALGDMTLPQSGSTSDKQERAFSDVTKILIRRIELMLSLQDREPIARAWNDLNGCAVLQG